MFVFAHRGASIDKPENTLAACEEAIVQGATGIELDVIQVEDEFFVLHDRWLERTTNGSGLAANQSKAYVQGLLAGDGLPIPTLAQAINLISGRCMLNIELKFISDINKFAHYIEQSISPLLGTQIIVSSFHYGYLQALMQRLPIVKFSAITASYDLHLLKRLKRQGFWGIHQAIDVVDQQFCELAHKNNLKLLVYTCDREEDWMSLRSWKVDGVFTNIPGRCQAYLSRLIV